MLNPIVTELWCRKLSIPLFLLHLFLLLKILSIIILLSYCVVPKNIRVNSTDYFIMKIPKKQELQHIAFNYLLEIGWEEFMNLYQKSTAKRYSFLTIGTILASGNL